MLRGITVTLEFGEHLSTFTFTFTLRGEKGHDSPPTVVLSTCGGCGWARTASFNNWGVAKYTHAQQVSNAARCSRVDI